MPSALLRLRQPLPGLWLGAGLALLLCLLGGPLASAARAGDHQVSVMQDDDALLYRGFAVRDRTLNQMRALGVDAIRVTLMWSVVAEHARSTPARARRFKPAEPGSYPAVNWDRYDGLVRDAGPRGIAVYFNVTGPGPAGTGGRAPHRADAATWRPDPAQFGAFVRAVGLRYSGTYHSAHFSHALLPRVSIWSIWNEPNQPGWLTPQSAYSPTAQRTIPQAPITYRELYIAGRRALRQTGHERDVILMGDTAPLGTPQLGDRDALLPGQFIRELFCLDAKGHPYRGAAAVARRCRELAALSALPPSGWAHHPYAKKRAPRALPGLPDAITIGNLGDLSADLDKVAVVTRVFHPGLPIALTEFGYESNPPDPFNGLPLATQAAWDNEADLLAYSDPRVVVQTQFLLRDSALLHQYPASRPRRYFGYQTGLETSAGKPKPALSAYVMPFVASHGPTDASGNRQVLLWGQLRFLPHGAQAYVALQWRPRASRNWQTIGPPELVSNTLGFYSTYRPSPGAGRWRSVYTVPGTKLRAFSRQAPLA